MTNKKREKKSQKIERKRPKNLFLTDIGLSPNQALIYDYLISMGPVRAYKIALFTGLSRPLVYKIIDQLKALELIEEKILPKEKVKMFSAAHPSKLENLVTKMREKVDMADNALEENIPHLLNLFNHYNTKPQVFFFEGVDGLRRVYSDILKQKSNLMLIRSYLDDKQQNISQMIDEQKMSQARQGIIAKVISPRIPTRAVIKEDITFNVERRYISSELFSLPAQILIFGNKVAITSFEDEMITTVIDNLAICHSFRVIFNFLWKQGIKPEEIMEET